MSTYNDKECSIYLTSTQIKSCSSYDVINLRKRVKLELGFTSLLQQSSLNVLRNLWGKTVLFIHFAVYNKPNDQLTPGKGHSRRAVAIIACRVHINSAAYAK